MLMMGNGVVMLGSIADSQLPVVSVIQIDYQKWSKNLEVGTIPVYQICTPPDR